MRGFWRVLLGSGLAVASIMVQSSASAAPVPARALEAYAAVYALIQAHKCPELLDMVANPSVAALLATLSVDGKLAVDEAGVECALQAKQYDLALKFATAGTDLKDPRPQFWLMRLDIGWATGNHAATIATMETMATANPDALSMVKLSWLGTVNVALDTAKETDLKKRLNAVFGAPGYHSAEPGASTDNYRYAYAVDELEAGHAAAATAIFAQITQPFALTAATLDPRLRSIVPTPFDARLAVERHRDAAREVAAAHPDDLRALFPLINDYSLLDQGAEMLALLLPMRPGAAHPAIRASPDDARHWWSAVVFAYRMLGDYDNVIATWRQSMAPGEVSEKDTWVPINISQMQLQFGHPSAALETLEVYDKSTDGLSPVGVATLRGNHGCAEWYAGNTALAEADLAYLHEHNSDSPMITRALALCMHRDDEVSASLIKDLADPVKASGVLLSFSTFAPPPATYPHDWYREGLMRLMTRADIKAAIAKAGGVGNFDIPPL